MWRWGRRYKVKGQGRNSQVSQRRTENNDGPHERLALTPSAMCTVTLHCAVGKRLKSPQHSCRENEIVQPRFQET